MTLNNLNPATTNLIPGLVAPSPDSPTGQRSREGYFMHNMGATYVLTADWPEDQERWDVQAPQSHRLRKVNSVEYLIDGKAAFPAMLEAIETAEAPQHFIILLGWAVYTDFVMVPQPSSRTSFYGNHLVNVLREKTEQGVKVRVLLWNNKNVPTEYTEWGGRNNLRQKVLIDLLNPPAPEPEETPRRALCILDGNTRTFGAHHQKVLLVYGSEGLIGFVGGIDVARDRIEGGKTRFFIGDEWIEVGAPLHDVHARVHGEAARDLLDLAVNRWNCSNPVRAYVTPEEASNMSLGVNLSWGEEPGIPRGRSQLALPRWGRDIEDLEVLTQRARAEQPYIPPPYHTVRIGQTVGNPTIAKQEGERAVSDAWPIIRHAIRQARKFIYIEDQYFWSQMAAVELAAALPNIERLIIMVTSDDADPSAPSLRHACIDKLFSSIAFVPDKVKVGIYNRKEAYERYIHAKMLIIDDEVAIIGSANMNNRGYTHDSEVIGIFNDPDWYEPDGPRAGHWYALELNLARKLRMQLWAEHLKVDPERLFDPLAAAVYWENPPPNANVMPCPYYPGSDGLVNTVKNATLDPLIWDPDEI